MLKAMRRWGRLTNYDGGLLDRLAARVRLPLDRRYNERVLPDIRKLHDAVERADGDGPHVMIATFRVWQNHAVTEAMIAAALRERGARVSLLSCGGGLPLCSIGWARRGYPRPCDRCAHFTDRVADVSELPHYRVADHLPWGADARKAPLDVPAESETPGLDYIRAGTLTASWMLRTTQPDTVPDGPEVLRDSAATARGVELAMHRIIDEARPDILVITNGTLVEDHVLAKVAQARGVRAVTYGYGIHENTLMLTSHEAPALEARNEELWEEVRDLPLSSEEEAFLDRMMAERERGSGTADYFASASRDGSRLREELGIPADARVVTMFTNVTWDSAAIFKDVAFPTTQDWLRHVARTAAETPDCFLVVRIHPTEASAHTAEPASDVIHDELPELPPNVRIIEGHEPVHSYTLIDASDVVLVYTSTVGMEAALRGKPVVVAGKTHYRGRGFTHDAEGPELLTRAITEGLDPLTPEQVDLARRYAYAFFFRLMVPVPGIVRQDGPMFSKVVGENISLAPGADPYLDLICDRILDGRPLSTPRDMVHYPSPFPPIESSPYGRVKVEEPAEVP